MGKPILKTNIKREKGYLYFVKGNPLTIYKEKIDKKKSSNKKSDIDIDVADLN